MTSKIINKSSNMWESFIVLSSLAFIFAIIFLPDMAFAGTGGEAELKSIYDKTEGIVSGYGAKIIALLAFVTGAIGAVNKNPWVFLPGFGTALVAGVGPTIFTSGVSALI